jgi:hypothetical protein
MEWIAVIDRPPPTTEPVVYARPNDRRPGTFHVGIAYWTVSQKWNPEAESQRAPMGGFTHWAPLPPPPKEQAAPKPSTGAVSEPINDAQQAALGVPNLSSDEIARQVGLHKDAAALAKQGA